MKKTIIYTAGPMDFYTQEEQRGWRDKTNSFFEHNNNFKVYDPGIRKHDADLTAKEIFIMDIRDVEKCDVVLADTRYMGKPQFGTPCEIFYASFILKKPVIGWYDKEHDPTTKKRIFQEALLTREFDSLDKALNHIHTNYRGL
jgi:nucleoside 2-deoxyribosyltransferase